MLRARIIPCLLLKGNGLVKSIKFKDYKYVGDPINAVRIFNEKEVDELVFLDISATLEGRKPNFKLITKIAEETFMPFGYGGGITDVEDAKKLFTLGAEKVILNSSAAKAPALVEQIAKLYGNQSVVASIDVKKNLFGKYEVYVNSGKVNTKEEPAAFAIKMQEHGAGEILLNSIDRDGTLQGYDLDLVDHVCSKLSIPVVACGGARGVDDFKMALKHGASAVAAGSMFVFHGKHRAVLITYPSIEEIKIINSI